MLLEFPQAIKLDGVTIKLELKKQDLKSGKKQLIIMRKKRQQILQLDFGMNGADVFMVSLLKGLDDGTIAEAELKERKDAWLKEPSLQHDCMHPTWPPLNILSGDIYNIPLNSIQP